MEHINFVGILRGYQSFVDYQKSHCDNEVQFWNLREESLQIDEILQKLFVGECTSNDWRKIKRITSRALMALDSFRG